MLRFTARIFQLIIPSCLLHADTTGISPDSECLKGMAPNPEIYSLVAGYVGFFVVLFSSTPAARSIVHRFTGTSTSKPHESHPTRFYEGDEDGDVTDGSLRKFSDKWQRVAIGVFSVTGFEILLGLAIITTVNAGIENYFAQGWLQVSVWVSSSLCRDDIEQYH